MAVLINWRHIPDIDLVQLDVEHAEDQIRGRRMNRIGLIAGVVLAAAALGWWAIGSDWRRLIVSAPTDADILFWNLD
ncbi:MAG: hypothetical protein AAFV54_12320, partial [Pseudomonadota bacterium]